MALRIIAFESSSPELCPLLLVNSHDNAQVAILYTYPPANMCNQAKIREKGLFCYNWWRVAFQGLQSHEKTDKTTGFSTSETLPPPIGEEIPQQQHWHRHGFRARSNSPFPVKWVHVCMHEQDRQGTDGTG